jgi:hypothetical protein
MSRERGSRGEGLSLKTLAIAGAASGIAAIVVPMVWERGTVFAAAATPVIVALVSELLTRPVEAVSSVRVRRTPSGTAIFEPPEPRPRTPEESFDPLAPVPAEELEALAEEPATPRQVHRRRRLTGRQWKLALATGLIAFLGVAAIVTASELTLLRDSVSSGERRTTFFGGSSRAAEPTPTPEATPTAEPEEQTPAAPTETPAPEATPPAAPGEAPGAPTPTPAPGGTPTPAPGAGQPPPP